MRHLSRQDLLQTIRLGLGPRNPYWRPLIKEGLIALLLLCFAHGDKEAWMVLTYSGSLVWLLFFSAKMDMIGILLSLSILSQQAKRMEEPKSYFMGLTQKSTSHYVKRCLPWVVLLLLYNVQVLLLLRLNIRELIHYSVPLFFIMILLGCLWLSFIHDWKRHIIGFLGFWGFMLTIVPWWGVSENTVWNPWMRLSYALYCSDLNRVLHQVQAGKPPALPLSIASHRIEKITRDSDGTIHLIEKKPSAAFVYRPDATPPNSYWVKFSLGENWYIGGAPKKKKLPVKRVSVHG